MSTGSLYTISAPSGAGKTSLVKAVTAKLDGIGISISHTTRARREREVDGVDYHFIDEAEFLTMVGNAEFLEHARVFRNYYGTSWQSVKQLLAAGKDTLLEIDWQGMQQVKRQHRDCISISILPPSIEVLQERLAKRESDSNSEISHRMAQAQEEMSHFVECDYVIINDDFDTAVAQLCAIINSERLRTKKQASNHNLLISKLLGDKHL